MAQLPDLLARIRVDTSDLESAVGRAAKSGSAIGSALGSAVGNLAANGFSAAARGIGGFAAGAVDAFARVEDATGAAGVQFGDALPKVLAFADKAASGFGISRGAALDAANTFGTLGKAAGLQGAPLADFSTKFAGLAGDLASFKGTSTEQAIEAVGAALRGESEPIRAYGVLLDDASLRQEALSQGLIKTTKEALTPQQKVLATQALILKQTTAAQGDYARTSDSTANTQKTLAAETENAQAALGAKLAPAVTALRGGFLELIQGLGGAIDAIGRVADSAQPVVEAFINGVGPALSEGVERLKALADAIPEKALKALGVVAGAVAAAIVVQTTATVALTAAKTVAAAVTGLFTVATNAETGATTRGTVARLAHNIAVVASTAAHVAARVAMAAATAAQLIWTGATTAARAAAVAARTAVLLLNAAFLANPFVAVAAVLALLVAGIVIAYKRSEEFRKIVNGAFTAVKAAVTTAVNATRDAVVGAFTKVRDFVGGAATAAKDKAVGAFNAMRDTVRGIVDGVVGFISGVPGRAAGALGALAGAVTGKAREAFGALSGAVQTGIANNIAFFSGIAGRVRGALGNLGGVLVGAGRALMEGLARGIGEKIAAVVEKVRSAVGKIKRLLPGSPIKDGPLTSWNRGGAGKRLMELLARGIADGGPMVDGAMQGVLGGLPLPEAGAVSAFGPAVRSTPTPAGAAAPTADPGSVFTALMLEVQALREDVRRLPGDYVQRQRTGAVMV